jgi:hypothetical protein
MLKDYYKTLTKRTVTQVPDGAGGFTETLVDASFKGYIAYLSSNEQLASAQKQLFAVARLFTEETLTETNRVVDGSTVFEVVGVYDFFHKYYDLKKGN